MSLLMNSLLKRSYLPIISSIYVLHYQRQHQHQQQQQYRWFETIDRSLVSLADNWQPPRLRSAQLANGQSSSSAAAAPAVFDEQWFEPFVSIKPRFAKADETKFPAGYVGPMKVLGSGYIFDSEHQDNVLVVTHINTVAYYTLVKVRMFNGHHLNGRVALRLFDAKLAIIKLESDDKMREYGKPLREAVYADEQTIKQLDIGQVVYGVVSAGAFVHHFTAGRISGNINQTLQTFYHSCSLDSDGLGNVIVDEMGRIVGLNRDKGGNRCLAINATCLREFLSGVHNMIIDDMKAFGLIVGWLNQNDPNTRTNIQNHLNARLGHQSPELPADITGAVVCHIMMGSTAHKAGINLGDIIVNIDGTKVESLDDLYDPLNDDFNCDLQVIRPSDSLSATGQRQRRSFSVKKTDRLSIIV
ncbi:serine protease HTRA2, mitochondrial-like [Oppia nitens]|uniref:serine protease HTRA2, mitochondrial-like n=1 Tax=Oppia nitens TaxID=1686743 RepID=UPI0023DA6D8D|nr:serine protease HTRA2, mitochondrial-like [Oppia nitens]